jgi:hypothetical protein
MTNTEIKIDKMKLKTFQQAFLNVNKAIIENPEKSDSILYAVYVWDTRQIIDSGSTNTKLSDVIGESANDNHKQLTGHNAEHFIFSKHDNSTKWSASYNYDTERGHKDGKLTCEGIDEESARKDLISKLRQKGISRPYAIRLRRI